MGHKYITDMEEKNKEIKELKKEVDGLQNEDPKLMVESLNKKLYEVNLELTGLNINYKDVEAYKNQLVSINYTMLKETTDWRTSYDGLNRDYQFLDGKYHQLRIDYKKVSNELKKRIKEAKDHKAEIPPP